MKIVHHSAQLTCKWGFLKIWGLLQQNAYLNAENLFRNGVKLNLTWIMKGKGEKNLGVKILFFTNGCVPQSNISALTGFFVLFLNILFL